MFERYTEASRRVIFFARYEASKFGSRIIETEHLLLGLVREARNVVNRFAHISGSGDSIREEVERSLPVREHVTSSIDLPMSEECKRILVFAAEEAERLNHRRIGCEHLLLGILREEKCAAAVILMNRGANLEIAREQLARFPLPSEPGTDSNALVVEAISHRRNPVLPPAGIVSDAETAKTIAEAVWMRMYGAQIIADQQPLSVEIKFNVWLVTGSSPPESALFVFILRDDGRILSVGKGTEKNRE